MRTLRLLPVLALAACGGATTSEAPPPTELPVLTLGAPTLEIGAVDGAEEYLFASIASAIRLSDGTIAVSDPGNTRISIYSADGTHVRSFGSQGDGPTEFTRLSRIYAKGVDSILAVDERQFTVSSWHLEGLPGDQKQAAVVSGDETFALDAWLHGRFWIDGALTAVERNQVRATLDNLPVPRAAPGYRYARVTRSGALWVREPGGSTDGMHSWTRVDASGAPSAVVHTPESFEPIDIGTDEVIGRWTGEADVSFVRVYALSESGATTPTPAWLQGHDAVAATDTVAPPDEDEMRATIVSTIKNLASAQEIHYSQHYSYTDDIEALAESYEEFGRPFELPEEIMIDFVQATPRGWSAVFTHPLFDRACGLAYGYGIPAGWTPGMVMCAPPLNTDGED